MGNIFISDGSEKEAREVLTECHPDYNITNRAVTGNISYLDVGAIYVVIHIVGMSIPIAIMIWIMRRKIIAKLGSNASSERSKRLQLQLLKALTFQSCIPIFYVLGSSGFAVQQFNIINNAAPQYIMYCVFILVPVLNPFSSFIFITPYRKYVISLFDRKSYKISVTQTTTQLNSSAINQSQSLSKH